ncbi:MAG: thiamine diphosphokinase [Clostridia bacterium]|nr:thiamine diphosphokinase [Clostridia bacterium]
MNFLIISGGEKVNKDIANQYYQKSDYVICVDKGLEYAREYGIKPHLIMGDMDSVDKKILDQYKKNDINVFPQDKDYTDTDLAVKKAIILGAKKVFMLCATGTRMDHTLSNIKLLIELKENRVEGVIVDNHNEIRLIVEYVKIEKKDNQIISLIPLDDCYDVTTKGLKFPVIKEDLQLSWNMGNSNEIIADYGEISLKKGNLLLIISKESE